VSAIVIALIAAVVYGVVSLIVGDRFPFSRYSMYARLTTRAEGAVLYVRAGERFVAPDDLEVVHGLDIAAIDPKGRPCSQEWLVYEAQRWLKNHAVVAPPEDGIAVEVGYRMLRIDKDGLHERLEPVTRGTGKLRT
jgi:hypothetical protein